MEPAIKCPEVLVMPTGTLSQVQINLSAAGGGSVPRTHARVSCPKGGPFGVGGGGGYILGVVLVLYS